jgi:hypothetical protein
MIEDWSIITIEKLQDLWQGFLGFIPSLLAAVIIFIIGWVFACGIGSLVAGLLKKIKFNKIFESAGWRDALQKAEVEIDPAGFIGAIFKWIVAIVFLLASVEIIGAKQFAVFLTDVVKWLPNLLVVVAIFIVAAIAADFIEKIVKASVKRMELENAKLIGSVVRWAIYIFAASAILLQLGIAPTIINSIVIGIIGMFALAFGLAFGLGGREEAARVIKEMREKITDRK